MEVQEEEETVFSSIPEFHFLMKDDFFSNLLAHSHEMSILSLIILNFCLPDIHIRNSNGYTNPELICQFWISPSGSLFRQHK